MTDPIESDPDATKLDIGDVELTSQRDVTQGSAPVAPPPLPPDAAAPPRPSFHPSYPPPPPRASLPPPQKRPPMLALVVAFVLVGLVVGGVLSMTLRKPKEAEPRPAVITIPTVELDDVPDSGR